MQKNKNEPQGLLEVPIMVVSEFLEDVIKFILVTFESILKWLFVRMGDLVISQLIKVFPRLFKVKHTNIDEKELTSKQSTTAESDLGYSVTNKKVLKLNSINSSLHNILIGAAGFGKTNCLNLLFQRDLKKGVPIIFIDPKGNLESLLHFKELCAHYQKKCYIFSNYYPTDTRFNPLQDGEVDQITNRIMTAFVWDNPYYQGVAEKSLRDNIIRLKRENTTITFNNLLKHCSYEFDIQQKERQIANILVEINKAKGENKVVLQDELKGLYKTILGYQEQKKELVGLINQLERINHSSFGKLFNVSKNDALTITKIRKEKACLYIGLPTQGFGDIARSVGKIFLGELLYHSDLYQTIYADSHISINNPLSVYFDETGSIIVPDFIELLNKCRSSGVQCTTCIQSISDLDRVSENIKEAIIESTSSNLIIFKQAVSRNAEFLSSLIGTFESTKETNVMEDGEIQTKGSTRDVQKFFCSPNLFKRMPVGKGILVRWNPFRVELVNFRDTRKSMVFKEIQRSVDQKMEATVSKADEISKKTSPQSSGGKNIY